MLIPPERSFIGRILLPLFFGLAGVIITIGANHIPYSHSSVALGGMLILFLIAQGLWLKQIIQPLRPNLKEPIATPKSRPAPLISSSSFEEESIDEGEAEAKFLLLLQNRLDITHPLHIEAKCIHDAKAHLIQTKGLIPLLKDDQLEIMASPVVNLPQKRLSFFKCVPCITIENGALINLNSISSQLRESMAFGQVVDMMVLFQTLQFIRHHYGIYPTYRFICLLPPSIYKNSLCLDEIIDFLHKSRFPFHGLIFEVALAEEETDLKNLMNLHRYGVRFIGNWQNKPLPDNLTDITNLDMDFIMVSYPDLSIWMKQWPRRQALESLQEIFDLPSRIIVSQVSQEQDLYQNLPLAFDFAIGPAFGVPKSFNQIQI